MSEYEININREVIVELTAEGIEQLIKEWNRYAMPNYKADISNFKTVIHGFISETNKIQLPLWDLMKIFGDKMYMGAKPMFVNNNITLTDIE